MQLPLNSVIKKIISKNNVHKMMKGPRMYTFLKAIVEIMHRRLVYFHGCSRDFFSNLTFQPIYCL